MALIPPGACDCHVHVVEPGFPFAPERRFMPGLATTEDLVRHLDGCGLERVVIVQVSAYGSDNSCLVRALRKLGRRGRGVAVVAPGTSAAELRELGAAGVCGLRVNLESAGPPDVDTSRARVLTAAAMVADAGWHLQVYARPSVLSPIAETLGGLSTPVVLDHFGLVRAAEGVDGREFRALLGLLRGGNVYVKVSAPYRVSDEPGYADAAPLARALVAAAPERVIWGSDWPHTGPHPGVERHPDEVEPFRQEDDRAALERLAAWLDAEEAFRRVLVDNAARLFGFD